MVKIIISLDTNSKLPSNLQTTPSDPSNEGQVNVYRVLVYGATN
jgi:hypothetical protein